MVLPDPFERRPDSSAQGFHHRRKAYPPSIKQHTGSEDPGRHPYQCPYYTHVDHYRHRHIVDRYDAIESLGDVTVHSSDGLAIGAIGNLLPVKICLEHHTFGIDAKPNTVGIALPRGAARTRPGAFLFLHAVGKRSAAIYAILERVGHLLILSVRSGVASTASTEIWLGRPMRWPMSSATTRAEG